MHRDQILFDECELLNYYTSHPSPMNVSEHIITYTRAVHDTSAKTC